MIKKGKYRHFKGKYYEVIGVGRHSETLEEIVIYYDEKKDLWARPATMFAEEIENNGKRVKRFEFIGNVRDESK